MARRRGSGRVQQNIRKIPIQSTITLGALASKDVISGAIFNNSDTLFRMLNYEVTWTWDSVTAGDGPLTVGIAAGDYSAVEIEECLEAIGNIQLGDRIAQEQANRLVRVVGNIQPEILTLNDGMPVKTKLNWKVPIGDAQQVFAYNQGGSAFTTGSALLVFGHAWIKFL